MCYRKQGKYFVFNCSAEVGDDYDGPHLVNGKVTEDFVKQLLEAFRDQKKLHQKYAYQVSYTKIVVMGSILLL